MAEHDLVGSVAVGRYRVTARIATGATADVYEAQHVSLGTQVALKVLRGEHADSELAARFLREGKTLGMFRHRNIVELLEVGRLDDGSLFLATELVRGVSLRTVIEGGNVEPRRALGIIRQVLDALAHAHTMGVIHRDVRPDNIMLATEAGTDVVKMLDFGVAKLVADTAAVLGENKLTKAGFSAFGDPRYIAPESVLGTAVDARADLYSTGVVLYELLAGQPPFTDPDPSALMQLHAYAPVPPLADRAPDRTFAPELELLVADALAKKPEQRFRSTAEMASAVDAALHSLEPLAPVPTPTAPPPGAAPEPQPAPVFEASPSAPRTKPPSAQLFPPPKAKWQRDLKAKARQLVALARQHKLIVGAVAGTLFVVIVIAVLVGGGGDDKPAKPSLAKQATELIDAGNPKEAVALLDRELAAVAKPDGATLLVLGHARFAIGRRSDALAAYERALAVTPKLASDPDLRANVASLVEGKDTVAAIVALEMLATRVQPPAHDLIVATAATAKHADVRRRALAIAEREGLADRIDRVATLSLDLAQATTCEDRRAVIGRLRATADKRAVAPLKRAKAYKCVAQDASEAIAALEATP